MHFKRVFSLILILVATVAAGNKYDTIQIESKIDSLLSIMTLDEKIGQLEQYNCSGEMGLVNEQVTTKYIGSVLNLPRDPKASNALQKVAVKETRLGIPVLIGFDVIHGLRTIFPVPLAESSSWEPELAEQSARVAAIEASAHGINWTFAPMVDIARDARWGRIVEGAGEDNYLGGLFAAARVRGFQGEDLADPQTIAACAKHFVAYGAAIGGRDYNTVDMSEQLLRNIYLPPFKAAVDARVATLMSSFNDISGVPATANPLTLTTILRGEWGFTGFVVSDWNSVEEQVYHGYADSRAQAGYRALNAGVEMEMNTTTFGDFFADMVHDGSLCECTIDQAVRRILRIKYALGLFENPYVDEDRLNTDILTEDHKALALKAAQKSIVLLKNESGLLPLAADPGKVAVIGPLADSPDDAIGTWRGDGRAEDAVTILQALKSRLKNVTYISGCNVDNDDNSGFQPAIELAEKSDVIIAVMGEKSDMNGEGGSRAFLGLPGNQQALLKALKATGKPVVLVLMNGRPLALEWEHENIPAIVESWHLGIQHGPAVADVLFGDVNPSGKLTVTFPRVTGQEPLYYDYNSTGRPYDDDERWSTGYMDVTTRPLYPFGYGLSYTTFEYSDLELTNKEIDAEGALSVSVQVKNNGKRDGQEIVQLYIQDVAASLIRPVKQLKAFEKISLKTGETKTVQFKVPASDLGFYNADNQYIVEPGKFNIWVGPASDSGLEETFYITN